MIRRRLVSSLLASALAAGALAPAVATPPRPRVVATTTLLASLAAPVAGTRADVSALLPVGASPETYEPTATDVAKLHRADVIVENGAGLEAWLAPLLGNAAAHARLVDCTAGLPVVAGNPHLWLDPTYARQYVAAIRDALVAADPSGAADYRRNAAAFDAQLVALDGWIRDQIATVPPANRNLIVFHNAWLYYARRYGLTVLGAIEEIPGAEPSAAQLARLVDAARAAHVHAIFAEPEYNPKLVQTVARSAGIPHVAVLYDDSVGTSPATRDYLTMLRTDTATIVAGLR